MSMTSMVGAARDLLRKVLHPRMEAARAYDLWAATYDEQSGNVLLFLDEELLMDLLASVSLEGKTVVDVGCGTGRHWAELLARRPGRLVGFDVSTGMLARLRAKFPGAEAHVVADHRLGNLADESVDVLISTLALGYMPDSNVVLAEWSRVLKPAGDLLLTDLHPQVARTGARCFRLQDRTIHIRHYPHSVAAIHASAANHGLAPVRFEQKLVDESLRGFYQRQGADRLYLQIKGTPLIYAMRFTKRQARHVPGRRRRDEQRAAGFA